MIEVNDLTVTFGRVRAVDDLSFSVAPGEAVALWGENGAGKTTVVRSLLGLVRYRGAIRVAGLDARRDGRTARRAIGYVPQELALYDDLRLPELLRFLGRLKGVPRCRDRQVLAEVGLEPHRRKRVAELSGGMKQRLALAVALLADPPLLLLDELTANLDAAARSGFLSLLQEQRGAGKTVLFTTHHHREVRALADRVLVLESGRLAASAAGAGFASGPPSPCVMLLRVAPDQAQFAARELQAGGFDVSVNGCGLRVAVASDGKALPLRALHLARIDVEDFELLPEAGDDGDG